MVLKAKPSSPKEHVPIPSETEAVGKRILDAAYRVHTALGPGLLENVYEICLAYELRKSGLLVETQVVLPIVYQEVRIESGLRLDMLVENQVVVELKAVENIVPLYEAQLITYLKLSGKRLGFLFNFNTFHLKDGFKRLVL